MERQFLFFAIIFSLLWLSPLIAVGASASLEIISDGHSVVEPGIFVAGCIYGKDASLSDHAPVVFEEQKTATWNIANRVSHKRIETNSSYFFGHKFKLGDNDELVDADGKPAIENQKSETAFDNEDNEIDSPHYGERLIAQANKIKELFERYHLDFITIQETPNRHKTHTDGKTLQDHLRETLLPDYEIHFPQRPRVARQWPPDVALITKKDNDFERKLVDGRNLFRLQPYCSQTLGLCIVATHLKFPWNETKLSEQCRVIIELKNKLLEGKINTVRFVGDFNSPPANFDEVCSKIEGFDPVIRKTNGSPQHCNKNDGSHSEHSVDLMMEFNARSPSPKASTLRLE